MTGLVKQIQQKRNGFKLKNRQKKTRGATAKISSLTED